MDFSILYRVVWKPGEVFKQFKDKARLEPYILIAMIVLFQGLKPYWRHFEAVSAAPLAFTMNLLFGFLLFILFPIADAVIVTITASILGGEKPRFLSLLSAFILCALPYYIETVLVLVFGYTPLGLGSLFQSLETSSPFAFGMVATVTPFFLWTITLWWFAVKQLLSLQEWKNVSIVASLAVVNIILGGWIWRMTSSLVPK